MVNEPKKASKIQSSTINSVLTENKTYPKSKQQIDKEHYQKNKEHKKQQRREKYQQQKLQTQQQGKEQSAKYYGAEAIKVLMSFKEYTELNQEKRKLWLDFNWTLKDCQELIKEGFGNVVAIMKLAQVADNLIRDYWTTAKNEIKKGKSWNSLDQDQKDRLIKYWGYEKTRIENNYLTEEERLEKQSQGYLKEIELAKFHEERGKVKCSCYSCEAKKEIQAEVKDKMKKELEEYDRQSGTSEKEECPSCGKLKVLDEEVGVCKGCVEDYG